MTNTVVGETMSVPMETDEYAAPAGLAASAAPGAEVLVVDDSSFVRYGLRRLLTAHGYRVVEAGDGEAAVAIYASRRPAVALLDITMPKMDGLEALRRIRLIDPVARVAMVTGMGQRAIVMEAIKSGASDFIVKPFDHPRVLNTLQKLLGS